MRSLGFTLTGAEMWNQWAQLCCNCGLCTLYACPEDLYPKEACDRAKVDLKAAGIKFTQEKPVRVHPMKDGRRVPLAQLRKRLRVEEYERHAPLLDEELKPRAVRLKLLQHFGQPAAPVVRPGDRVKRGATVARVPDGGLGADIHASISGKVAAVTADSVVLEA
jgi:Na+-translocating ferredoxin:NAD+ oxidoreductase RnfC subunit